MFVIPFFLTYVADFRSLSWGRLTRGGQPLSPECGMERRDALMQCWSFFWGEMGRGQWPPLGHEFGLIWRPDIHCGIIQTNKCFYQKFKIAAFAYATCEDFLVRPHLIWVSFGLSVTHASIWLEQSAVANFWLLVTHVWLLVACVWLTSTLHLIAEWYYRPRGQEQHPAIPLPKNHW